MYKTLFPLIPFKYILDQHALTTFHVLLSVLVHMADNDRKVAAEYNNLSVNDTHNGGCTFINAKTGKWFTDTCSSTRLAVCKGTSYSFKFARCFLKTFVFYFLVYSLYKSFTKIPGTICN